MIKFFRRLRKKLLIANKFNKYLVYAIGEIVLVVIGILIALTINNWNENQKNDRLRASYLFEMMKEVHSDILNINRQLKRLDDHLKKKEASIKKENLEILDLDSLKSIVRNININFTFKNNTFNKMNNLGLTKLSGNDDINNQITNYYNSVIPSFILFKEYLRGFLFKDADFFTYTQKKIDLTSDFSNLEFPSLYKEDVITEKKFQQKNIAEFIQTPQGRALVLKQLQRTRSAKDRVRNLQSASARLLYLIFDELKKNNPKLDFKPTIPNLYITKELQLTDSELSKFVGTYQLPKNNFLQISIENSKLYGRDNASPKIELRASSKNTFYLDWMNEKVIFTVEKDSVVSLTTSYAGDTVIAKKIK